MKGFRFCIPVFLSVGLSLSAFGGEYAGLWVGTATLNHVSEINARGSDLSFDLRLVGIKSQERLVENGSTWLYNDSGSDMGTEWRETGFDDGGGDWLSGDAGFGFGADQETTVSKHPTTYFRKRFTVDVPEPDEIPDVYSELRLRVWRDDGVIVYLNGDEVLRNNLKTSFVDYDSYALTEISDINVLEISLPTTSLLKGSNTLAVEVHLADDSDLDLFFNLELIGVLQESVITQLIDMESTEWKYHHSEAGPGSESGWQSPAYDDSAWLVGKAQFGYGEDDQNTPLPYGSTRKPPAVYFRKAFDVPLVDFTTLRFLLLQDDGAVVYLNGDEVYRTNMPSGDIEHDTPPVKAIGSADENRYIAYDAADIVLSEGSNTVAVEVHQHPGELGPSTNEELALTRTPATFGLRFILHVDADDVVRLLKEVIQMYDAVSEKYVLLTDHTLVPSYQGVAVRDNEPTGRRISAVGFDFAESHIPCDGEVSPTGTVTCDIALARDHPTNPFLHRYHPDHDNVDGRYEQPVEEAYGIARELQISFSNRYPPDTDLPERPSPPIGWGKMLLGGSYNALSTPILADFGSFFWCMESLWNNEYFRVNTQCL